MTQINEIKTIITADNKQFKAAMKESAVEASAFSKSFTSGMAGISKFFAGGILAAGAFASIKDGYQSLDRLTASAEKLGVASSEFQFLEYAAKRADVEIGSLEQSLTRMRLSLSRGTAGNALDKLGLGGSKLSGKSTEESFYAIVTALQKMDKASQIDLGTKIFGKGFQQIITLVNSNLKQTRINFEDIGGAVDTSSFDKIDEAMDNLNHNLENLKRNALLATGPLISMGNAFFEATHKIDRAVGSQSEGIAKLLMGVTGNTPQENNTGSLTGNDFKSLNKITYGTSKNDVGDIASNATKQIDLLGIVSKGTADALKAANAEVKTFPAELKSLLGLGEQSGASYLNSILPNIQQVQDKWFTKIASDLRDSVAAGADPQSVAVQSRLKELQTIAQSYNNSGNGTSNSGMLNAVAELQKQADATNPRKDEIVIALKVDNNSFVSAVLQSSTFKGASAIVQQAAMSAEAAATVSTGG